MGGTLLYTFETGVDNWKGATPNDGYSGSSAQAGVYQNTQHATLGTYSLRVAFDHQNGNTQAVFLVENLNLDLTSFNTLSFDLWKSGQPPQLTVSLTTGDSVWFESLPITLKDGSNTITVDLKASTWKCAASNWANNAVIANKNAVKRIAIIFIPSGQGFNEAFIDNVRVDGASGTTTAASVTTAAASTTKASTTKASTSTGAAGTTGSGTTTGSSGVTTGFVTRSGTKFMANSKPFYFGGTNNYYVIYKSQNMVNAVFDDAKSMGLSVIRIWAMLDIGSTDGSRENIDGMKDNVYFQSWANGATKPLFNDGALGLQKLDYVLAAARSRGLRLVLTLVNNWKEFGGMDQYVAWFQKSYHHDFYTDSQIKQAYKDYVAHLVNRVNSVNGLVYKNDPTIFSWELTNELRCKGSGRFGYTSSCTPTMLVSWVQEMSAYIKSIDSNHMVTVGDEGFFARSGGDWTYNGSEGPNYEGFVAVSTIDYGTFHIYTQDWGKDVSWGQTWITDHVNAATAAGKPAVMEEYGWKGSGKTSNLQAFINTAESLNIAGTNYWMLSSSQDGGGVYSDYDGYTIYNDASADASLIKAHAARQTAKNV